MTRREELHANEDTSPTLRAQSGVGAGERGQQNRGSRQAGAATGSRAWPAVDGLQASPHNWPTPLGDVTPQIRTPLFPSGPRMSPERKRGVYEQTELRERDTTLARDRPT